MKWSSKGFFMSAVEIAKADDCYFSSLGQDPELVDLVQQFVDELPSRIMQLHESLESHRLGEVARFAHQLKGAGGSYGFPQLTSYAERLERLAKQLADEMAVRSALNDLVEVTSKLRACR
jgi:HPt (histidine-containing phosphotransfer) domain-containing protein